MQDSVSRAWTAADGSAQRRRAFIAGDDDEYFHDLLSQVCLDVAFPHPICDDSNVYGSIDWKTARI